MASSNKGRAGASAERTGQAESRTTAPGNAISLLTADKLKQIYVSMLKCRMVEERAELLLRASNLDGNYLSSVGREATGVATGIELLPEDTLAPAHRDIVTSVVSGAPLESIFAGLFRTTVTNRKRRSYAVRTDSAPLNVITPASAIDSHLSMATGVALAYQLQKRNNVAVVLSGDDSASIAIWHESLNFAGIHKLPVIYVVENELCNHKPRAVEDIGVKAEGYFFPVITVDGNDAVAVYRVVSEGLSRARNGGGPTMIECRTCRDGARLAGERGGRLSGAVEHWKSIDPIPRMERYLKPRNLWSEEWKREIVRELKAEIEEAVKAAERSGHVEDVPGRVFSFSIRDREPS